MPTLRIMPLGATMGNPGNNHGKAGKREACRGWSPSSSRNNSQWLMSRDPASLPPGGWVFSLTLRDVPESPDSFKALLHRFLQDHVVRKLRAALVHWVMEFQVQTRFCPHIHLLVYPSDRSPPDWAFGVIRSWLHVMRDFNPSDRGQAARSLYEAGGWFTYVAKHSARSFKQAQRLRSSIPPAWQGFTGRVWGRYGDWPSSVAVPLAVPHTASWWLLRRILRRWARSKVAPEFRRSAAVRRVADPSFYLEPDAQVALSKVRGLSAWCPLPTLARLVRFMVAGGHIVFVDHHVMETSMTHRRLNYPLFPLSLLGLPTHIREFFAPVERSVGDA